MCFRPAESNFAGPVRCPVCGKINKPDASVCIKCGATEEDMRAASASAPAPEAPAAPKSPDASSAPGTPPPAAPKAPNISPKR